MDTVDTDTPIIERKEMDTETQSDTQFCEASTREVIPTSNKKRINKMKLLTKFTLLLRKIFRV